MKKATLMLFFAASSLFVHAQKVVYDPNVERRSVTSFHAIQVSSGVDLFLSEGDEAVAVSGKDAATTKQIKVEVVNGVLKIGFDWKDRFSGSGGKNLRAYVSFRNLDALSASGGSDIMVEGTIRASKLKLDVSGGSDFKGNVVAETIDADASGGSDIIISGTASTVVVDASGGSDFNGFGLVVNNCKADASGGSDIEITVNGELKAEASGGSDVIYKGDARSVSISKSGASTVRRRN